MTLNHLFSPTLFDELFRHNVVGCDGLILANDAELLKYRSFLLERSKMKTAQAFKERKCLVKKVQALMKTSKIPVQSSREMKTLLSKLDLCLTEEGTVTLGKGIESRRDPSPCWLQSLHERKVAANKAGKKVLKRDLKQLGDWLTKISGPNCRVKRVPDKATDEWKQMEFKGRARMKSYFEDIEKSQKKLVKNYDSYVHHKWISSMEKILENIADSKKWFDTVRGDRGYATDFIRTEEEESVTEGSQQKDDALSRNITLDPERETNQVNSIRDITRADVRENGCQDIGTTEFGRGPENQLEDSPLRENNEQGGNKSSTESTVCHQESVPESSPQKDKAFTDRGPENELEASHLKEDNEQGGKHGHTESTTCRRSCNYCYLQTLKNPKQSEEEGEKNHTLEKEFTEDENTEFVPETEHHTESSELVRSNRLREESSYRPVEADKDLSGRESELSDETDEYGSPSSIVLDIERRSVSYTKLNASSQFRRQMTAEEPANQSDKIPEKEDNSFRAGKRK